MEGNSFLVSVIIPVHKKRDSLKTLLNALSQQTYPYEKIETIIVNNHPESDLTHIFKEYPSLKTLQEKQPGSYKARNTGILNSSGDIIAFIDSDCIPSETWIESGVNALLGSQDKGVIGGAVVPAYKKEYKPNIYELYESLIYFDNREFIESLNFSITANMFVFRHIFDKVGLFNDHLKSGGDKEWGNRAHKSGYKIIFADNVEIYSPPRRTFKSLYQKELRVAGGIFDQSSTKQKWVRVFSGFIPPIKRFLRVSIHTSLSLPEKLKLFVLLTLFKIVNSIETVRLLIGGKSKNS